MSVSNSFFSLKLFTLLKGKACYLIRMANGKNFIQDNEVKYIVLLIR